MPKIDISMGQPLLSAQILGMTYGGKENFVVVTSREFESTSGGVKKMKPALLVKCQKDNQDFLFVLNATNQRTLGNHLLKVRNIPVEQIDTELLVGCTLLLESYDTGGSGTFKFGTRILEVHEPLEQTKLGPKPDVIPETKVAAPTGAVRPKR